MKHTVVEWLVEQLKDMEFDLRLIPNTIEQAKEMEKQQIIRAYMFGDGDAYHLDEVREEAEEYYKETFNK